MATIRGLALTLAATAALVLVASATAKELTRAAICGRHDVCAVIRDPQRLRVVPTGGATSVAVPPRQPYYLLTFTIEHGGRSEDLGVLYLPESNLLAANGVAPGEMVWLPIDNPRSAELMRDAVATIEPHPEPTTWPWPHGLKSIYRVIPDDAFPPSAPSSSHPHAVQSLRPGEDRIVPVIAVAVALGLAAAALLLRRLAPHEPRDERSQALAR
jgi:hypothetical protein